MSMLMGRCRVAKHCVNLLLDVLLKKHEARSEKPLVYGVLVVSRRVCHGMSHEGHTIDIQRYTMPRSDWYL